MTGEALVANLRIQLASEVAGACACFKARQAARLVTRIYDEELKSSGLRATQFSLLTAAAIGDAPTLSDLADLLGMERTTLLRNLAPLERRDLITVSPEGYRRARRVTVSETGMQALDQALPLWRAAQDRLRRALGEADWSHFHRGLSRINGLA